MKWELIALIGLSIIGLYIIRNFLLNNAKSKSQDSTEGTVLANVLQVKKTEIKNLSKENKVELSWKFLTNITNKVLNYFTKPDQELVTEIGKKMNKHDMRYIHNVDLEVKLQNQTSINKNISKDKKNDISL